LIKTSHWFSAFSRMVIVVEWSSFSRFTSERASALAVGIATKTATIEAVVRRSSFLTVSSCYA
jgi:hypothetical protein